MGFLKTKFMMVLYPLLKSLKKSEKRLILATSKPQRFTEKIMEHFDLAKHFEFIAGSNMDGTRSKKADVIEYALTKCHITDK